MSNYVREWGQSERRVSAKQIDGSHRQNQTGLGPLYRKSVNYVGGGINANPTQTLHAPFLQTLQDRVRYKVLELVTNAVILKVHRRGNVRVEATSVKSALVMLKKVWDMDAPMNPGADFLVAFNPRHVRVPSVCKLMETAASKGVRVAQTEAVKGRRRTARENI